MFTDDERWYWQLDFKSNHSLTIVSIFVCVPFDIWMRIKALCSLKYRTSIIHMITLPYNKNVDIKECMKFKILAELSLQQRCSPSYLSVSAFNQRGVVNTFMKWGLGPQTSLTPLLLIELSLPSKDFDRSCYLCVRISIFPVPTILLEFWIFWRCGVFYFSFF